MLCLALVVARNATPWRERSALQGGQSSGLLSAVPCAHGGSDCINFNSIRTLTLSFNCSYHCQTRRTKKMARRHHSLLASPAHFPLPGSNDAYPPLGAPVSGPVDDSFSKCVYFVASINPPQESPLFEYTIYSPL